MGFNRTDNCFFTGNDVISCDETDGKFLDGYYYRVKFNESVREVRLSWDEDWDTNKWIKEKGTGFFNLLENTDSWHFFDSAKDLDQIKHFYFQHDT